MLSPLCASNLRIAGHGADAHDVRIYTGQRETAHASERLNAELGGLAIGEQHGRGGAVVGGRAIAGGHRPALV